MLYVCSICDDTLDTSLGLDSFHLVDSSPNMPRSSWLDGGQICPDQSRFILCGTCKVFYSQMWRKLGKSVIFIDGDARYLKQETIDSLKEQVFETKIEKKGW